VKFKIGRHSAFSPPGDAVELLWKRLGARREEISFTLAGEEIRGNWSGDERVSMTHEEASEIGRLAILEIISEVCERTPELKSDWYAVSPVR